ncbi:hypothetical protein NUITMVS1_12870 [Shewanella xiamenensis]|nr:hypothetical protein NUITMVS1_12870 [Shewanella xiamenensis]
MKELKNKLLSTLVQITTITSKNNKKQIKNNINTNKTIIIKNANTQNKPI